ncbi:MAG: tryptophan--tRNA ligase [Alphaproteobacteria bacterium]|nr:tryptophan--tRNA ligase [Alphaproteobacteria bacterium]
MTKRILSGMQPTNNLHLGNYLGALKNWVALQEQDFEAFYMVADLHAITAPYDETKLAQASREVAAAYIAAGVDINKSCVFVQSAVRLHSDLNWLFSSIAQLGKLDRMTQFKEKSGKNSERAPLGLYAYPVLMAADIMLYHATHVPVGDDQRQHLELTRDIASSFNHKYKTEFFPVPEAVIVGAATRVMSLRDGTKKMSKSEESDNSRINMTDDADTIASKIKKAKTDPEPLPDTAEALKARPEADNLVNIYAALSEETKAAVLARFAGKQFSAFKPALADLTIAKLAPINTRYRELLNDTAELDNILRKGAEKARAVGVPILEKTYDIMGFWRGARGG